MIVSCSCRQQPVTAGDEEGESRGARKGYPRRHVRRRRSGRQPISASRCLNDVWCSGLAEGRPAPPFLPGSAPAPDQPQTARWARPSGEGWQRGGLSLAVGWGSSLCVWVCGWGAGRCGERCMWSCGQAGGTDVGCCRKVIGVVTRRGVRSCLSRASPGACELIVTRLEPQHPRSVSQWQN